MEWSRIIDFIETKTGKSIYKEVGCRSQYISDLKSGKSKNPGADFVLSLIEKFNLNPDWLLTGEGEMFKQNPEENLPDPVTYQVRIPVMSHNIVCDGANWENERNIEEYIDINNLSPSLKGRRIIGFRAKGTSMIGAGINNNDIVLFTPETDSKPEDGLYVFSLDGDAYCKRLEFDPIAKRIKIYSVRVADLEKAELLTTLCSTDPGYEERFYLFGKVFSCIHSFMN